MSWVAAGVTVGSAIFKGVSAGVKRRKARKAAKKEKARLAAEADKQAKSLKPKYDALAQSQRDLGNMYQGQTSMDAEGQYAKNANERSTSAAIERASRAGSSTSEIMNMVSGLTAKGQMQGQEVSAAMQSRRDQMDAMAKTQAIQAAQTGLAGEEAMIGVQDKGEAKGLAAEQQISAAYGEAQNYESGMVDDIGAAGMYGVLNSGILNQGGVSGIGAAGAGVSAAGVSKKKKK